MRGGVTRCFLFVNGYILSKMNSSVSARWPFQKYECISTVARLDFKSLDTLSKNLGIQSGCFSLSSHRLREKFSLPVLAEFAFAVCQGETLTMGRQCYRYQSSSGSEINGQPYHVCCGSAGQVVSSRDPFHVTRVYESSLPAT